MLVIPRSRYVCWIDAGGVPTIEGLNATLLTNLQVLPKYPSQAQRGGSNMIKSHCLDLRKFSENPPNPMTLVASNFWLLTTPKRPETGMPRLGPNLLKAVKMCHVSWSYGQRPKSWGYPQFSSIFWEGIFHHETSSYWGIPIYGNPHMTFKNY